MLNIAIFIIIVIIILLFGYRKENMSSYHMTVDETVIDEFDKENPDIILSKLKFDDVVKLSKLKLTIYGSRNIYDYDILKKNNIEKFNKECINSESFMNNDFCNYIINEFNISDDELKDQIDTCGNLLLVKSSDLSKLNIDDKINIKNIKHISYDLIKLPKNDEKLIHEKDIDITIQRGEILYFILNNGFSGVGCKKINISSIDLELN